MKGIKQNSRNNLYALKNCNVLLQLLSFNLLKLSFIVKLNVCKSSLLERTRMLLDFVEQNELDRIAVD